MVSESSQPATWCLSPLNQHNVSLKDTLLSEPWPIGNHVKGRDHVHFRHTASNTLMSECEKGRMAVFLWSAMNYNTARKCFKRLFISKLGRSTKRAPFCVPSKFEKRVILDEAPFNIDYMDNCQDS